MQKPEGATQRLAEARRACVIHAEEFGVTQRAREVAQSLRELTQGVFRLTQRIGGLTQCFSYAGEGFVGQIF